MPNERFIPNGNTALVLKFTAHIDKHMFSNSDIFTAVCVEAVSYTHLDVYKRQPLPTAMGV